VLKIVLPLNVALTVTWPKPFVGDKEIFGPASNCVTPPFAAYDALNARVANEDVKAYEALVANEALAILPST
jgi:hypothetical protein